MLPTKATVEIPDFEAHSKCHQLCNSLGLHFEENPITESSPFKRTSKKTLHLNAFLLKERIFEVGVKKKTSIKYN